jgi:hypothetical protein
MKTFITDMSSEATVTWFFQFPDIHCINMDGFLVNLESVFQ